MPSLEGSWWREGRGLESRVFHKKICCNRKHDPVTCANLLCLSNLERYLVAGVSNRTVAYLGTTVKNLG